jgi:putative phosphoribosyl transferase
MRFRDRAEAGRRLAAELARFRDREPVVLALPRGGVPVAYQIAAALDAPLDLILVRKIGAPFQRELAVAAIVDGEQIDVVVNEEIAEEVGAGPEYIEKEAARQAGEIERRRRLYLCGREPVRVRGRTAIVVDDGIATGATMRAALRAVGRRQPAHLVLAVPVAPPETIAALRAEVDEVVCLATPTPFFAIGNFYDDFHQVADEEVRDLLERAARSRPAGSDERS